MSTPLKRKLPTSISASAGKKQKQNSITSFFAAPPTLSSPATTTTTKTTDTTPDDATSSIPTTTTTTTLPQDSTSASAPASLPALARPKFDKEKWVAGLPAATRELLKLEIDTLHESWLAVLREDVASPSFLDLKRFLARERAAGKKIFPKEEDIYSWSQHTPLPTIKAIILGQDPYHGPNQAHGLSFSVRPPQRAPPSLKNIYIALKNDYPASFHPPPNQGGLLTPWADQGVLMLNTCLTVEAGKANSHANHGWEKFTQRVIDVVVARKARPTGVTGVGGGGGVVFLAWGKPAGERLSKVNRSTHCVLQSVHPSPLSAARGFFTCNHFKKTNAWLRERYGEGAEIDWNLGGRVVAAAEAEGVGGVGGVGGKGLAEGTAGVCEKGVAVEPGKGAAAVERAVEGVKNGVKAAAVEGVEVDGKDANKDTDESASVDV